MVKVKENQGLNKLYICFIGVKNKLARKVSVLIFVQNKVHKMLTTTISDFRKDIKKYIDTVSEDFETLIINRGKDQGVVIISLEEYNSMLATSHELSSKKNQKRLDAAIDKLKAGKGFQKKLSEK
jgi:antitoxin YefM